MKPIPKVYNKRDNNAPKDAVYIGRGSPWGNPFKIGADGNRDEVCDKFEAYLNSHPELKRRVQEELVGKNLVCFCKPARCHGDAILKIANSS